MRWCETCRSCRLPPSLPPLGVSEAPRFVKAGRRWPSRQSRTGPIAHRVPLDPLEALSRQIVEEERSARSVQRNAVDQQPCCRCSPPRTNSDVTAPGAPVRTTIARACSATVGDQRCCRRSAVPAERGDAGADQSSGGLGPRRGDDDRLTHRRDCQCQSASARASCTAARRWRIRSATLRLCNCRPWNRQFELAAFVREHSFAVASGDQPTNARQSPIVLVDHHATHGVRPGRRAVELRSNKQSRSVGRCQSAWKGWTCASTSGVSRAEVKDEPRGQVS